MGGYVITSKKKSLISKEVLLAGVASGVVFGAAVVLKRPIPVDLVLAGISWVGFWCVLSGTRKAPDPEEIEFEEEPKYSHEVLEIIARADEMIAKIRTSAARTRSPNTSRRLKAVTVVAEDLLLEAKKDPEMLLLNHSFLNTYLGQTEEMAREYASLARTGLNDPKAQDVLREFDTTLDTIEEQFKSQRDKIINRRIESLSISQEVFRKTAGLEGN